MHFRCLQFPTFRAPEVEEFRMNLYEAKTPILGKGGVAAPSRKMARRHVVWRERGGSSKLPLESIRRLNEPPRLRPAKGLRDISLMGAATPPSPRRGIPAHSVFLVCCKLSGEIRTSEVRSAVEMIFFVFQRIISVSNKIISVTEIIVDGGEAAMLLIRRD